MSGCLELTETSQVRLQATPGVGYPGGTLRHSWLMDGHYWYHILEPFLVGWWMINIMAFIVLLCLFPQNMGIIIGVDPSPYPKCFRNKNTKKCHFGGINQCSKHIRCWMLDVWIQSPGTKRRFFFGETAANALIVPFLDFLTLPASCIWLNHKTMITKHWKVRPDAWPQPASFLLLAGDWLMDCWLKQTWT